MTGTNNILTSSNIDLNDFGITNLPDRIISFNFSVNAIGADNAVTVQITYLMSVDDIFPTTKNFRLIEEPIDNLSIWDSVVNQLRTSIDN